MTKSPQIKRPDRRNESPIWTNNNCTYDGDLIICDIHSCKKSLGKKIYGTSNAEIHLANVHQIQIRDKISHRDENESESEESENQQSKKNSPQPNSTQGPASSSSLSNSSSINETENSKMPKFQSKMTPRILHNRTQQKLSLVITNFYCPKYAAF